MELNQLMKLCTATAFVVISAHAGDLAGLTTTADAVVVGVINSRMETRDLVSFDLTIERTIKGALGQRTVHVSHPWNRRGVALGFGGDKPIDVTLRGVWFLRRTDSGDWDVLPVGGPGGVLINLFLPAAQTLHQRYVPIANATPLDAVVLELGAALESDSSRIPAAIELLKSARTTAAQTVASAYITSSTGSLQAAGIAIALAQSHPNAISDLRRLWPSVNQDRRGQIIKSLRDDFRDGSRAAVEQLSGIAADAAYVELRPSAVQALAALHTKEALPFLASLLKNGNSEEKMKAVYALSSFANGCPAQTSENVASLSFLQFVNPSSYRTPETISHFAFRRGPERQEFELVTFWLNWWSQHQKELTN